MYIYYNKEGKPTTTIPHGYPVKQGNDLKVTMCFETDFFDKYLEEYAISQKDIMLSISLIYSNGEQSSDFIIKGGTNGPTEIGGTNIRKQFIKLSDNEESYDLINYKEYLMFDCSISASSSTVYQGSLKFIVKMIYQKDDGDIPVSGDIGYLDTAQLFVDPTWGNAEFIPDLTGNQYEQLLNAIAEFKRELSNKADVGKFPFKSIELKGVTFTFTSTDDKQLTADINVKNTSVATITVDESPKKDSNNLITSGAVFLSGYKEITNTTNTWLKDSFNDGLKSIMLFTDDGMAFFGQIVNHTGATAADSYQIIAASNLFSNPDHNGSGVLSYDLRINYLKEVKEYHRNEFTRNSSGPEVTVNTLSSNDFPTISKIYVKGV